MSAPTNASGNASNANKATTANNNSNNKNNNESKVNQGNDGTANRNKSQKQHNRHNRKNAPKANITSSMDPAQATPANSNAGTTWSAGASGGNAISWLSQQTHLKGEAPKSSGALEYLTKQKKDTEKAKGPSKAATAVPTQGATAVSGKATVPAATTTNTNLTLAERLRAAKEKQAGIQAKQAPAPAATSKGGGVDLALLSQLQQQQQHQQQQRTATPQGSAPTAIHVDVAAQLASLKLGGAPSAAAPAPAPAVPAAAPTVAPATEQQQQQRGTQDSQRRQHQRHRPDRANRQRRQQEVLAATQKRQAEQHEEAMKNDPEYRQHVANMQQLGEAMMASQNLFFAKYAQQQQIASATHIVTQRLNMPEILDVIDRHDVLFICTDTGSGKSTNVPKALLELSPDTRVVSTQPRRTATVAIANRVAELRRESVGEDVGYWIRGEKRGDEQTRLWYMTSYTLLLRILESPSHLPFTHIILDEFHERQPDIEVTVALLRLALLRQRQQQQQAEENGTVAPPGFKLILMSATLYTDNWEEYFAGLRVATYKQSEPEHPIHDYFLEDACALLGVDYTPAPHLAAMEFIPKTVIDRNLNIAQNLIVFLNRCSNRMHSILVFLPGRAQVEMLQLWLNNQMAQTVDAVPWHSAIELADIEAAMRRHDMRRQKVYLATDIAEVSITLPDVVFVIDLVLVKRPKINKNTPASILYPPLVTQWISKSSISQRRGRVGRVQQGFYFCLFPADQFQDLTDYAQPPIENSRIDELSLHCLEVVSNPAAIFGLCHGQPLAATVASAMNTLQQLGCIVEDDKSPATRAEEIVESKSASSTEWNEIIMSNAKEAAKTDVDEFFCTFIGRMLQLIPVAPQPGTLVFLGFLTGLESLMILAAAVTSSLSPFTVESVDGRRYNMARAMEETENVMRNMCCGLRSDVLAVMKVVLQFRVQEERVAAALEAAGETRPNAQRHVLQQWCSQNHVSLEKLQAINDMQAHIKSELVGFMPFRDVTSAAQLLEQLDRLATIVVVMTTVAFVSHSLEVTSESNTYLKSKEMGVGVFNELVATPDIHSPSCLRWQDDDIIVPVQLNLMFDKLLAGFSTAVESSTQYWLSLLLFSYRLQYATFSDDEGTFHVFSLNFCGKTRFVEMDEIGGMAVLEFRRKLNRVCASLRLLHANREVDQEEFLGILQLHSLKPIHEAQKDVVNTLATIFKNLDSMTAIEVEHEDDDLDLVSALSFAHPVAAPHA